MINARLRTPLTQVEPMPITGYLDRLSARPGETLVAHVSTSAPAYEARLVRVISGDPNPAGPGMRFEDHSSGFKGVFEGRFQTVVTGSSVIVPEGPRLDAGPHTWTALVWLARQPELGVVLAHECDAAGIVLSTGQGKVWAELNADGGTTVVELDWAPPPGRWARLWLSLDPEGRAAVGMACDGEVRVAQRALPPTKVPSRGQLRIAARADAPDGRFTGKIEAPAVYGGFVGEGMGEAAFADGSPLAQWRFEEGIGGDVVIGVGPAGRDGRTINDPTRAMTGSRWTGREHCWRHAPEDYAAIYFHEDDVGDCGWAPSFSFKAPEDLESGAYALHLSCERGEDWLPFYVLPRRAGSRRKLVFLAPTFTYLAYANCFFANRTAASRQRAASWGASPYTGERHGAYGRSTYNWHVDGSGVALSSRLRPILTMRPGFVWEDDPKGSGLRHYPADTHLLAWLEAKGFAVDVVTDEDLDDEGADLLAPYEAVITGSHPEYHTPGTLDALQAYLGGGGSLAYLGGNGFYWRIARGPERPDLIEVRRAEGGIRLWAAEPGEYYHALDGQLGGMWRRNGRTPQALVGIGFSAQGPFAATAFRRTGASHEGPFAWIFDGVTEEIVGAYGLSGGGAAGFELDRRDAALGTPDGAEVLATSLPLPEGFGLPHEEMLTESLTITGEAPSRLLRGDMTYLQTKAGGAIFSAGSVTFCGSLWRDGRPEGPISKVLENVLRRFAI